MLSPNSPNEDRDLNIAAEPVVLTQLQRRRFIALCAAGASIVAARPLLAFGDNEGTENFIQNFTGPIVGFVEPAYAGNDEEMKPEQKYDPEKVSISWLPRSVKFWSQLIEFEAKKHGLDPNYMAILITLESAGHPTVVNKLGAQGLGQVMPGTQQNIVDLYGKPPAEMTDPAANLDYMATLLEELFIRYGKQTSNEATLRKAVAADYNGSPIQGTLALRGIESPIDETRNYVRRVEGMWQERMNPMSLIYEEWLQAGGDGLVALADQYVANLS